MIFRRDLTFDELIDILDTKYIAASSTGHTLPPGIYEISDNNLTLKSLIPDDVEVNFKIADIRLKSDSTTNRTTGFIKKTFFYTLLCFNQSYSRLILSLINHEDIKYMKNLESNFSKREKNLFHLTLHNIWKMMNTNQLILVEKLYHLLVNR